MTLEQAKILIQNGCDNWPQLVEAAGTICDATDSTLLDLMACLKYRGLPSEFAAMKLHQRTQRQVIGKTVITDQKDWNEYLRQRHLI